MRGEQTGEKGVEVGGEEGMEVGGEWVEKEEARATQERQRRESGKTICRNNNVPHHNSSCLHPQRKGKQVPCKTWNAVETAIDVPPPAFPCCSPWSTNTTFSCSQPGQWSSFSSS